LAEIKVNGTDQPYASTTYKAQSNDRNTLSVTSYFKLLASQLANQDMTNPMSTSDMMNQMSQMAMVQSLTAMTESVKTSSTLSRQSYAAGMIGQEVTYNGKAYSNGLHTEKDGSRSGIIDSISFSGDEPTFHIKGDPNTYALSAITEIHRSASEKDSTVKKDTETQENASENVQSGT